ncbi:MAG: pectate lyase [Burkholderiales bacterium]|nr:pectate lyase [Burkholderiales bacterium]
MTPTPDLGSGLESGIDSGLDRDRRRLLRWPLAGLPSMAGAGAVFAADDAEVNRHTFDVRGWAARTRGGRGGRLLRVTTLAAAGPGSLREALESEGARVIVFEVGGVVDMAGATLVVRHPFVTVAGQTAPSPGITVVKAEVQVSTHDVVVQHLRFRPGEFGRPKKGGGDQDGLSTLAGAHDVIVDHCSFSWATDENLSASGPRFQGETPEEWRAATSHDITFSHNLVVEGLGHSVHEKGEHSKGSLIHDNTSGILLYRNAYISNRERNALFKGGARGAMVNNLVFNPGRLAAHYNLWNGEWQGRRHELGRLALVGNVLRHGPDTEPGVALLTLRGDGDVELFAEDNLAFDREGRAAAVTAIGRGATGRILRRAEAGLGLPADVRALPAARLEAALPHGVGARPWDRDAIDARVLAEMAAGRGRLIDSEAEHALGYPRHAPTRRPFDAAEWDIERMAPRGGWSDIGRLTRPAA